MGTSTYFGSQVASIPHLERGDEVARDLRNDVDAAFVLLEADLGGIVGGLTQGNIIIGDASNLPSDVDMGVVGAVLVGTATTASAVTLGTIGDILVGNGTQAVAVTLTAGDILVGNGVSAAALDVGATAGGIPIGDSAGNVVVNALSGPVNMNATGVTSFPQATTGTPTFTGFGERLAKYTAIGFIDFDATAHGTPFTVGDPALEVYKNAVPDSLTIPGSAVVTEVILDVITPLTVGVGVPSLAITLETLGDVKVATQAAAAPYAAVDQSLETVLIKTTAARQVLVSITGGAGATVTAGRFLVMLNYYVTE